MPAVDFAGLSAPVDVQQSPVLQQAINLFLDHGCLLIENAFDGGYVGMLASEFSSRFERYFADQVYEDALATGDKRTMVTLDVEGPFGAAEFFAPSKLFPLFEFLLTERLIIAGMGAVISLPGAQDQHRHRDYTNIYDPGFYYPAMESFVANAFPYAITLGIPLVPIDKRTGCTRFWPGTHLSLVSKGDPNLGPGVEFEADIGSAYIFDYRVLHGGVANTSDIARPLLYVIYTRPWFRDPVNYSKQEPIDITEEQLFRMPVEHQRLFSWAVAERAARARHGGPTEGLCVCGSGLLYKRCHGRAGAEGG